MARGMSASAFPEAERRQAKHDIQHVEDIVIEMLRNARDAGADKVYLATTKEDGVRTLVFWITVLAFRRICKSESLMPALPPSSRA